MANQYGDLTMFNARGGDPVAEREGIKAEAVKRGTYLSQMDQFYAQLEFLKEVEAGKERMFGEELGFKRESLQAQIGQWGEENRLAEESLDSQTRKWEDELAELRRWHDMAKQIAGDEISSKESMFEREMSLKEDEWKLYVDKNAPVKYSPSLIPYKQGTFYRDSSAYGGSGIIPVAGGTIGASTADRWSQETAYELDSDLLSRYYG